MRQKRAGLLPQLAERIGRDLSDILYWIVTAIVIVAAFLFGWTQWQERGAEAHFYQAEYDAAVTFACTGEVGAIIGQRPQGLDDFLATDRDTLSCEEVFPLPTGGAVGVPNFFHEQIIGSIYLFGWLWKLFGISWAAGGWVAGLFSAMTVGGMILLSRLLVPQWPALAIAPVIFLMDDGLRDQIIHLRDYSKAAFFFGLLFLLGAIFEASGRRKILLGALAALGISFALGFRQDTSPFVYMFGLVLLAGLAMAGQRRASAGALAVFILVLIVFPYLVFDPWKESGTNVFHFYVLGQALPFLKNLALEPSFFVPGYVYNDTAAWASTGLFEQARGIEVPIYSTDPYDAAGRSVFLLNVLQFPADVAAKALSSLTLALFGWLPADMSVGLALAAVTFCILLYYRRATGLIVVLVLAFFAAITFIQFDVRHVFLYRTAAKILLACAGILVALDLARIATGNRWFRSLGGSYRQRMTFGALPLAGLALIVVFIGLGRLWQGHTAAGVTEALSSAPAISTLSRDSLSAAQGDGRQMIALDMNEGRDFRYARLNLADRPECARAPGIAPLYQAAESYYDWSQRLTFFPRMTAAIYLPLIQTEFNELKGLVLDRWTAACFVSLEQIALPKDVYPAFYWVDRTGNAPRTYYRTGFEAELGSILSRATEKHREMTCLPPGNVLTPQARESALSHELVLGDVIELRVDDAGDGYESDHVDLIRPRIVVDGAETSLLDLDIVRSNIPYYTLEYGMTIDKSPLTLNGQVYPEGFGVHAPAMFRLAVPRDLRGKRGRIEMLAGLDDETGPWGSAKVTLCYSQ